MCYAMEIECSVSNYAAFHVESRHVIRLVDFLAAAAVADVVVVLTDNNDVAVCVA